MSQEFWSIVPTPPPHQENFATHQLAHEFRHEVHSRRRWQEYCQWYRLCAQQHQRELQAMRGEMNFFRWFLRR